MVPIKDVDISSSAFKADPYPFYAQLRGRAPVHRIILGDKWPAWLVTWYDDMVTVLKDDRFGKDKREGNVGRTIGKRALDFENDPADRAQHARHGALKHTRLRGLAHMAFTPWIVETCATHPAANRRVARCHPRARTSCWPWSHCC